MDGFNYLESSASSGLDSGQEETTPSYLQAADIHSFANGQGSISDSNSWLSSAAEFSMSAIARGLTSAYNIIPAANRMFGGSMEYAKTEDVLRTFDDNTANYYLEHQGTPD